MIRELISYFLYQVSAAASSAKTNLTYVSTLAAYFNCTVSNDVYLLIILFIDRILYYKFSVKHVFIDCNTSTLCFFLLQAKILYVISLNFSLNVTL